MGLENVQIKIIFYYGAEQLKAMRRKLRASKIEMLRTKALLQSEDSLLHFQVLLTHYRKLCKQMADSESIVAWESSQVTRLVVMGSLVICSLWAFK